MTEEQLLLVELQAEKGKAKNHSKHGDQTHRAEQTARCLTFRRASPMTGKKKAPQKAKPHTTRRRGGGGGNLLDHGLGKWNSLWWQQKKEQQREKNYRGKGGQNVRAKAD